MVRRVAVIVVAGVLALAGVLTGAAAASAQPSPTGPCVTGPYRDVAGTSSFCGVIAWLVRNHDATGYPDGRFHPDAPVSRQAAAAFAYRVRHDGRAAPACTRAPFPDVPVSGAFCGEISWLAGTGTSRGYADGRYRPAVDVSRQAIARFLYELFATAVPMSGVQVLACAGTGAPQDRPASLVLACGDGNVTLTDIAWSSFGGGTAVGAATLDENDCTPNCVSGTDRSGPAVVTLSDPGRYPASGVPLGSPTLYLHLTAVPQAPNTHGFAPVSVSIPG